MSKKRKSRNTIYSIKGSSALLLFNGRGQGKYADDHMYVAALTKDRAAKILSLAIYGVEGEIKRCEILNYYTPWWAKCMKGVKPTKPCVYVRINKTGEIIKLL